MYSETCCASLFIVSTYESDSCLNLFFFSGKIIYLGASVRFCCISVLLAGSEESVGGWSSQWPFRQPTHTHRRTHTTAPSHPFSFNMPCEGSAEGSLTPTSSSMSLFGCTWHGRYTLVCSHALSHNKTTQNCLNILPALCMRSHAFQMLALSLFALLSLLFVFTQSHANTLSGSICTDWIDGLRAFCWLRRCQLWWVIGKLCLAATLSALVIHFVNPNL